jgi:protein MpaA
MMEYIGGSAGRGEIGHSRREMRRRGAIAVTAALAAWLAGCASEPGPAPELAPRPTASAAAGTEDSSVIGRSVHDKPIECRVLGDGMQTVLLIGTIHGDESAGTALLEQMCAHLGHQPELLNDRRIVVVPVMNPDGLAARTRRNARGVDLNRNFPSENWRRTRRSGARPLSEPESRAVLEVIERYPPHLAVSIHQPLSCVDYDGPARELAESMARSGGLPVRKLGARPGSLGSYLGKTLGIPIITLELPSGAEQLSGDALWSRYGPMLLVAIGRSGADGPGGTPPARSP